MDFDPRDGHHARPMGLFVAVVLSRAAGLMYQVAWTRRLISVHQ